MGQIEHLSGQNYNLKNFFYLSKNVVFSIVQEYFCAKTRYLGKKFISSEQQVVIFKIVVKNIRKIVENELF